MSIPRLAIVVPCYNEEAVIDETARVLTGVLNTLIAKSKICSESFIYFVDDGSKDQTWQSIVELHNREPKVKALKLSRNFGHQNALLAGMTSIREKSDCVITIDADLQDDVSVIENFVDKFSEGYDIVYGVRKERKVDTFFKKYTALVFYHFMRFMGITIVNNHADFRLVSKRVVDTLSSFREANLFLRGIIPYIGFNSTEVLYDRKKRFAGETKYPLGKMLAFAWSGITSFSIVPLRIVTLAGLFVFSLSLLVSLWVLISFLKGSTIPGWASTVLPIYFIGGLQIFCIGLLGEYLGKVYQEVKSRPRFIKDVEIF
jgi:glycosyltransferase involved in cell wall biosynthesis